MEFVILVRTIIQKWLLRDDVEIVGLFISVLERKKKKMQKIFVLIHENSILFF